MDPLASPVSACGKIKASGEKVIYFSVAVAAIIALGLLLNNRYNPTSFLERLPHATKLITYIGIAVTVVSCIVVLFCWHIARKPTVFPQPPAPPPELPVPNLTKHHVKALISQGLEFLVDMKPLSEWTPVQCIIYLSCDRPEWANLLSESPPWIRHVPKNVYNRIYSLQLLLEGEDQKEFRRVIAERFPSP